MRKKYYFKSRSLFVSDIRHNKNIHVGVTWGGLAVSGEGRLEHGHRVQERSSLSGAGGGTAGHDATHPLQISSYFYTD